MRILPLLAAAALSLAPAAHAHIYGPERAMVELVAMTVDADRDDHITQAEGQVFADAVFTYVDIDADGTLSLEEMREWPFGFADIAAFRARAQAYDAAVAIGFDLFDRNGDGSVTRAEHADGVALALEHADVDGDGRASVTEFLDRFIFSVLMRHALVG